MRRHVPDIPGQPGTRWGFVMRERGHGQDPRGTEFRLSGIGMPPFWTDSPSILRLGDRNVRQKFRVFLAALRPVRGVSDGVDESWHWKCQATAHRRCAAREDGTNPTLPAAAMDVGMAGDGIPEEGGIWCSGRGGFVEVGVFHGMDRSPEPVLA
jgi:hypothetical protein